ncbi:MAG TPA: VanZ family protein [bacterium]|nr:VanZ family protein [bacterium]
MSRLRRLATAGWMMVILAGSLLPPEAGAPGGPGWHLLGYAVLGALLAGARGALTAWLFGVAYGALVEGLQWVVGYRAAEMPDVAVNAAGVALGLAAGAILRRALGKRRDAPPA